MNKDYSFMDDVDSNVGEPIFTPNKSGKKFDAGKVPVVSGALEYFSRAIRAVAGVSDYGFKKYGSWGGWVDVPDARRRYTDALGRHLLDEFSGKVIDEESGLYNDVMSAWNALARVELRLRESEQKSETTG